MSQDQQTQAMEYFRRAAEEWRRKAEGGFPSSVNVIEQRNRFALSIAKERKTFRTALDVGCGTGELACDLARLNAQVSAVDFAEEMIKLCLQKKAVAELTNVEFVRASIFEYRPRSAVFDFISANGFIEYISPSQLDQFLALVCRWLGPEGSFVVGSRNRLFNVFSLNEFTQFERELGTLQKLLEESLTIATSTSLGECLARLAVLNPKLPVMDRHPNTGIEVMARFQYTPAELIYRLKAYGLEAVELYPVHYHESVPRFVKEHPEVHALVADMMQQFARGNVFLTPSSSSFMIHAVRKLP